MHFAFIPYGKRDQVELLLRDMEAQKHILKMTSGKEIKKIYIQGQVRLLPLGVYEYVFPREDIDLVLHTLINETNRYGLPKIVLSMIRKLNKLKKIPEYEKDKTFLWVRDHVNIIPLGIREDCDIDDQFYKGFRHEAI